MDNQNISSNSTFSGEHKNKTNATLININNVLKKVAVGDFSERLHIPEKENELSELAVGVQLLIDDIISLSADKSIKRKEGSISQEQIVDNKDTKDIKEVQENIEMIIEHLTNGVIEYDSDFRIERINPAAEKILSVKKEEVIGLKILPEHKDQEGKRNLVIVSYPVLAQEGKRLKEKVLEKNASIHELVVDYPVKKEIEVITIPLTDKNTGERDGFIKVLRDITAEREISRSKSDFINIASHQLRTPLSAIKWVLRMILDGDVGLIESPQRKLLDKAYDTNEKMIVLVNDLLNVSRIEDDRFGYLFKEEDIVLAITDVVKELRLLAEKGSLDLIFEKPNNIPPFVFDYSKIQLAFHNLIGNAIKYTKEGGTVRVLLSKEDDFVVVKIQDTGVGIPEKQINEMFTKFFRAENVIRLQVGGSGLGLFIVKNIVARHGGSIAVKSVENKGTTFTLKIPLKHVETPENEN